MDNIFDWIMDFIYELAEIAIGWLPNSPFQTGQFTSGLNAFTNIMSYINYFIPIGTFVVITAAYLAAIMVWYGIRWVLRLAQYID